MTAYRLAGGAVRAALIAGFLATLTAACAYRGDIGDPAVRKTSWFSFLNGDDIRQACGPGVPPQYRLVYNARYEHHRRAYDIVGDGAGGAYLTARAEGDSSLTVVSPDDLLAPFRWKEARRRLTPQELETLDQALSASGLGGSAPAGLRLDSRRYYWVAIACREGRIDFNAWQHPDGGWERLRFLEALARLDETGVPIPPPRPVDPGDRLFEDRNRRGEGDTVNFELTVGEQGIKGLWTPF